MGDGAEAAFAEALTGGRARWPEIVLPGHELAARVVRLAIPTAALREHGPDLFLATACTLGDSAAIVAFEREHLSQVDSYVARFALPPAMLDEVRQLVRIRLLVDRPARIAGYRATGPLGGWVRVAAIRIALDQLASAGKRRLDETVLAERFSRFASPETEVLSARYRPVLQAALEQGIAALGQRDRALLRFHYVEGLNVEALGAIYHVHRATVARWLADIRRGLLGAMRDRVATVLQVSDSEFHSLVALMQKEMPLSVGSVLRK
jgi:RNA polymerase sigma-70 factor (ECF subfamily)